VRGLEELLRRHRLQPALVRLVADPVLGQRLIPIDEGEVLGVGILRSREALPHTGLTRLTMIHSLPIELEARLNVW
jgi:hypothetical protein